MGGVHTSTTKHLFLTSVLFATLLIVGAGCFNKSTVTPPDPLTLTIWRAEDSAQDFTALTDAYSATYPYVDFSIRTFKPEEYEDALFSAWSKGEGPDIFSIPHDRVGAFTEFVTPMPAQVKLKTVKTVTKLGRKQQQVEEKTIDLLTPQVMNNAFVDVVGADVIVEDKIYGVPLSMDTMVLYYNRDIMNRAGVAIPPATWEEFRDAVQSMVVLDNQRKIVQPAAALGTAENVPHFFDLLSLIMLQNQTPMTRGLSASFANETDDNRKPGIESLDFYVKFSDSTFKTYTWNDEQLDALEAFTQGTLGFYFGYYSDLETIENRAPNLNFSYSTVPQIDTSFPVNYPSFSVETVHITSPNADHAWNFIAFATSQDKVTSFLETTDRVPALRSLISQQQNDPKKGVFARQALTAKTWYHGINPDAAESTFVDMVNQAIAQASPLDEIMELAQSKITLTLQKK